MIPITRDDLRAFIQLWVTALSVLAFIVITLLVLKVVVSYCFPFPAAHPIGTSVCRGGS